MAGVSRGMSALSAVGFALVLAMCAGQAAALKFDLKVGATRVRGSSAPQPSTWRRCSRAALPAPLATPTVS